MKYKIELSTYREHENSLSPIRRLLLCRARIHSLWT